MAAITVTAGNVAPSSGTRYRTVVAGESVTQGQPVYRKSSDNRYYKADNGAQASARAAGIALDAASAGQPMVIAITGSTLNIGGTVTVGAAYYVGSSGGIIPAADLGSGDYVTFLGVGVTTTNIKVGILISDVAVL